MGARAYGGGPNHADAWRRLHTPSNDVHAVRRRQRRLSWEGGVKARANHQALWGRHLAATSNRSR